MASREESRKEWEHIREIWEYDKRPGYTWLIKEYPKKIDLSYLRRRMKKEGWTKKSRRKKHFIPDPLKTPEENKLTLENMELESDNPYDLSPKERTFLDFYFGNGMNASDAAEKAGYSKRNSRNQASLLLKKPEIKAEIERRLRIRCVKLGADADKAMQLLVDIINFDLTELMSYERYCCPCCWSSTERPQLDSVQYSIQKDKWEDKEWAKEIKARTVDDIYVPKPFPYEIWDKRKPPNPNCPKCRGNGVGERVLRDSRRLSPLAKLMIGNIEINRGEINYVVISKEKALDLLVRALGLLRDKDKDTPEGQMLLEELQKTYLVRMKEARERQIEVFRKRKIPIDKKYIEEAQVLSDTVKQIETNIEVGRQEEKETEEES